ncbi:MAG: COX15/CtaA family protein, partial [bacterium]
ARAITWGALVTVLCQAALGGLTVLMGTYYGWGHTDPLLSTLHAATAQVLLGILVVYATVRAPGWARTDRSSAKRTLAWLAVALVALIYCQIIAGAIMRHQNAGLAIVGFPLNSGQVIPVFYSWLVAVNFAHRIGAWLLVSLGTAFALRVALDRSLDSWVRRPAALFIAAVLVQFALGASVVLTRLQYPILTSCHVLVGAGLFAISLVLCLRLWALNRRGR